MDKCLLQRHRVAVLVVVICALAAAPFLMAVGEQVMTTHSGDLIRRSSHDAIVQNLEEQVTLLKWVGGSIVTALCATVGLLWRALEKANKSLHDDLVEGINRRENIIESCLHGMTETTAAVRELSLKVDELLKNGR